MENTLAYLEKLAQTLVRGCTTRTPSGVTLFTPDGVASYNALWLRDFSYMVEYAGENISDAEIEGCVRFALSGQRKDGWLPDRIYADGTAVYAAGATGHPIGEANLDNTPFAVFLADALLGRLPTDRAQDLFSQWEAPLAKGLRAVPLSPGGLVWSDPARPHSPYGFTDTVCKTGELMMESVLLWRAAKKMDALRARLGGQAKDDWQAIAARIERALPRLYDPRSGMFLAATGDCAQTDIWGSAYLLYAGFPAGRGEDTIPRWLLEHRDAYVFAGQIRHLPRGEYWQRLLIDVPRDTYQNGAYWATATGWVAWCLHRLDAAAAAGLVDAAGFFRRWGSFECVGEGYRKLPSFVVSATNVLGGARRIAGEDPAFAGLLNAPR